MPRKRKHESRDTSALRLYDFVMEHKKGQGVWPSLRDIRTGCQWSECKTRNIIIYYRRTMHEKCEMKPLACVDRRYGFDAAAYDAWINWRTKRLGNEIRGLDSTVKAVDARKGERGWKTYRDSTAPDAMRRLALALNSTVEEVEALSKEAVAELIASL